jgi:arylsulfatase A-like enzyme
MFGEEPKTEEKSPNRPNVLLVFADQMRGMSLGCMGDPDVQTPNLDRLAKEGLLFTNAVANCPVCTPARASLLTGLHPLTHRAVCNDMQVSADFPTLATVLKGEGYATGYVGKWHLDGVPRDKFTPPGPRRLGFDYWRAWNCHHDYFEAKCHGDTEAPVALEGYEPVAQTDLAVRFMREHRDNPFLLCLSWGPPHDPYDQVPEEYRKQYDPEKLTLRPNAQNADRERLANYYAAITALDDQLGRLMRALKELRLDENTLVIFTSDHGDMLGSHDRTHKEQPWEECLLVPLVMRWPARLGNAQVVDTLVGLVDLMPTILGLAGIEVPKGLSGVDLSAPIRGEMGQEPGSVFLQVIVPSNQARANGVKEWRGVRTKRYTYARYQNGDGWVLFDNKTDPYQQKNLFHDKGAVRLRRELECEVQGWLQRTGDEFLPWQEHIRELDMVEEWNERERQRHPQAPELVE